MLFQHIEPLASATHKMSRIPTFPPLLIPSLSHQSNSLSTPTSSSSVSPSLDIYTRLYYIYQKSHSGVRDYLIHSLYDSIDEEIDFILPQLCHLYQIWNKNQGYRLGQFLQRKCSLSIHLSLKIIWYLQAQESYATTMEQKERLHELLINCEMSLVNANIFGEGGGGGGGGGTGKGGGERERMTQGGGGGRPSMNGFNHSNASSTNNSSSNSGASTPNSLSNTSYSSSISFPSSSDIPSSSILVDPALTTNKTQARVQEQKQLLHSINTNYYRSYQEKRRTSQQLSANNTPMMNAVANAATQQPYSPDLLSPLSPPAFPSSSSSYAGPPSTISSSDASLPISTEEVFLALSKSYKSEYFNLELQLIHQLIAISNHIVKFNPQSRKVKLRRMLRQFNTKSSVNDRHHSSSSSNSTCPIFGLYFPFNSSSPLHQIHYRILSVYAELAIPLSSRDKAPFLFLCEIERASSSAPSSSSSSSSSSSNPSASSSMSVAISKSVYAYDIYTFYKSNEEIMREAIELQERGKGKDEVEKEEGEKDERRRKEHEEWQKKEEEEAAKKASGADGERKSGEPAGGVVEVELPSRSTSRANSLSSSTCTTPHSGTPPITVLSSMIASSHSQPQQAVEVTEIASSPLSEDSVSSSSPTNSRSVSRNSSLPDFTGGIDTISISDLPSVSEHSSMVVSSSSSSAAPSSDSTDLDPNSSSASSSHSLAHSTSLPTDLRHQQSQSVDTPTPTIGKTQSYENRQQSNSHSVRENPHTRHASTMISNPNSSSSSTLSSSSSTPATPVDSFRMDPRWQSLDAAFGPDWSSRRTELRSRSAYSSLPNWDLISVIFKHGDDCRQEVLACQLIRYFNQVFTDAQLPLSLHPYSVVITSPTSGLIETITDATSVDSLKKNVPNFTSLAAFFHSYFGRQGAAEYDRAIKNFVESMAAYSVLCYLLSIKDRHNGNIMLTRSGSIVHIDYGFMLSNSPGGNWGFESSPFKLTSEYVEVMGGELSSHFAYFKLLVIRGYLEVRQHSHVILLLIEILSRDSKMPCFIGGANVALESVRSKFKLEESEEECIQHVCDIIELSVNNWRTVQYDNYQKTVNGID